MRRTHTNTRLKGNFGAINSPCRLPGLLDKPNDEVKVIPECDPKEWDADVFDGDDEDMSFRNFCDLRCRGSWLQ